MSQHNLVDDSENEFVLHLDSEGLATLLDGPWPDETGVEFVLEGELPPLAKPANVPEHLLTKGLERGLEVCYYDPHHCRTCYCDGSGRRLYCVPQC